MNLVLTMACGRKFEAIFKLTRPSIEAYAKKLGADFRCIDGLTGAEGRWTTDWNNLHWEKFRIHDLLAKYHRVLWLDCDVVIRPDAPSLFDLVPLNDLGLFNEEPYTSGRLQTLIEVCNHYKVRLPQCDGRYFNTGVMVVPRRWRHVFKAPSDKFNSFGEQGYTNMMVHQELGKAGNELRVFDLPHKFNRMSCMGQFTGEARAAAYVVHYAGEPNVEVVPAKAQMDLDTWEKDAASGFKYGRHVLVDVQGGLGDQVDAQPAVRHLCQHVYNGKLDDVVVATHFPVLFQGLGCHVVQHAEFQCPFDVSYRTLYSLPPPGRNTMWSVVSNLLCHTVDFCSMALLRKTLPNNDKQIQIQVQPDWLSGAEQACGEDLRSLVLVHAGRHWPSKTFPVEWWQSVVDGLQSAGHKVCLIGQDELSRGFQPVQCREGMVDARNLLSLEELVATISQAKALVSNDSAPVHLAGAFQNRIVLIPSCKHPDHILPHRAGGQYANAVALYKRLTLDDVPQAPTEMDMVLAHTAPGDWGQYLPPTNVVCQSIAQDASTG